VHLEARVLVDVMTIQKIKCECGNGTFEKSTTIENVFRCTSCKRTLLLSWLFLGGEIEVTGCGIREGVDPKWKQPKAW